VAERAERRLAVCCEPLPPALVILPPVPGDETPVQLQGALEPALLHVRIAGFAALVELHTRPALAGRQVLICDYAAPHGIVLATLPAARVQGITVGMPLRSAEKLCSAPVVVEVDTERLLAAAQAILAILETYTPLIEPEWVGRPTQGASADLVRLARGFGAWLDVRGCDRLFGPAASIGYQLGRALSEHGYLARVGIATNPSLAAVASALASPGTPLVVPLGQERAFLERLPLWPEGAQEPLLDLDAALLEHVQALGIRRIGDLARLPASALRRRFGTAGVAAHAQARGEAVRQLALPMLPETLRAERELEDPCADRQRLQGEITVLATTLARQLAHRTWAATCVTVTLRDVHGRHTRTLHLKRPVATAGGLRTLLMDAIAQLLSPAGSCGPVCALRLDLSGFVPVATQLPLPLFGAGVQAPAVDAVARRLRSRFGPGAACRVHLAPAALLPEDQVVWESPGRGPVRGSRPVAVRVDQAGIPCAVRRGKRWDAIQSIHSQWRIRTRWWADMAHRHYYVVETATGAVLELYRDLPDGLWTLSGRRD
jgi:nucleotidyltransferase/DNA polymerase involved in DNA repair